MKLDHVLNHLAAASTLAVGLSFVMGSSALDCVVERGAEQWG